MSSSGDSSAGPGSRRTGLLWIVFVAAIVIAVGTVVAIGFASADNRASPSASPSATAGSAESPTPNGPSASTAPPAPTEPAPTEPGPGEPPIVVGDPLPIESTAEPDPGVTVSVGSFEAVQGEAQLAGDVAGPAIRFTVSVTNGTSAPVSLATALVNVYYGSDQSPASELQKPGGVPLPGEVAAGATVKGTLVFTVPKGERDDVLITVDYQVGEPVIAFEGAIP